MRKKRNMTPRRIKKIRKLAYRHIVAKTGFTKNFYISLEVLDDYANQLSRALRS